MNPIQRRKRNKWPGHVEFNEDGTVSVHIKAGANTVILDFDHESWSEISRKIGDNPFWSAEPVAVAFTTIVTDQTRANVKDTPSNERNPPIHPDWLQTTSVR